MRSRPDLRRVVSAIDRDLPVYGLITARAAEQRQTANLRLLANVLGGFALLGLVLAALGIFGVVSYSTAQRAGELGMRMALGARQSVVLWLVLRQGVGLTMLGAVAGLAGGLGLGRVLASMMPNLPAPEILDHARRPCVHGCGGARRFLHSSLARIEDQSDARPAPRIAPGRRV